MITKEQKQIDIERASVNLGASIEWLLRLGLSGKEIKKICKEKISDKH